MSNNQNAQSNRRVDIVCAALLQLCLIVLILPASREWLTETTLMPVVHTLASLASYCFSLVTSVFPAA